ncbi:hypothetical protein [Streptomyces sp. RFCAC02]|uniref:hypothetical protein n=1 Tax=Streptomyces sp. RFCAC02 TaxID=2499143 RepID=UPI0010200E5A|nr:hypothetical protein [Streptomyces sp. RFCAC02]
MSSPHELPDITDPQAMRSWLAARRANPTGGPAPRSLSELRSAQLRKLARSLSGGSAEHAPGHPVLRFSLDGEGVRAHQVESALLGDWLRALQNAVQSIAYALDELRPTREFGPIPKEIQRKTRLFSGAVFASSYGMVLASGPEQGQAEIPGVDGDTVLDRAMHRILDVADRASIGDGAEDAVLESALPLGRRAMKHLSELSDVLASHGTNATLNWETGASSRRSTFTSRSAERCRTVLSSAHMEDATDRLTGTVVGGSKLRGSIEIEAEGSVIVIRAPKHEVTSLLAAHAERRVTADVHVLTARSAGGREHRSYLLLDLSPHDSAG